MSHVELAKVFANYHAQPFQPCKSETNGRTHWVLYVVEFLVLIYQWLIVNSRFCRSESPHTSFAMSKQRSSDSQRLSGASIYDSFERRTICERLCEHTHNYTMVCESFALIQRREKEREREQPDRQRACSGSSSEQWEQKQQQQEQSRGFRIASERESEREKERERRERKTHNIAVSQTANQTKLSL